MAKEVTTTLHVSGWHCGNCSAATEGAIKKVPGVKAARSDLKAGTVAVTYDDEKAKVADLEKAVERVGYKISKP